jgi:hypothetical protein
VYKIRAPLARQTPTLNRSSNHADMRDIIASHQEQRQG